MNRFILVSFIFLCTSLVSNDLLGQFEPNVEAAVARLSEAKEQLQRIKEQYKDINKNKPSKTERNQWKDRIRYSKVQIKDAKVNLKKVKKAQKKYNAELKTTKEVDLIDPEIVPPKRPCSFADMHQRTNDQSFIKQTMQERLFTYTPAVLRSTLKQPYITAYSSFIFQNGGYYYLELTIEIATKQPRREFGILEEGSLLKIELLNGEILYPIINKLALPQYDRKKETSSYRVLAILSSTDSKLLRKHLALALTVYWSKGFERYDIHDMNLLQDQLDCLLNGDPPE